MKKITLSLAVAALFATAAFAHNIPASQVPDAAKQSIAAKYPNAKDIDWEMKQNLYEAEVEQPGMRDIHVLVDASGNIVAEKHEMNHRQLPAALTQSIQKQHPGYRIDDVDRIVRGGKTYYQVELEAPMKADMHVVMAENGVLQKMDYWH